MTNIKPLRDFEGYDVVLPDEENIAWFATDDERFLGVVTRLGRRGFDYQVQALDAVANKYWGLVEGGEIVGCGGEYETAAEAIRELHAEMLRWSAQPADLVAEKLGKF